MKKNKFYITTPIYYVNSKPHLGTLYSTLLADVAARWHKLLGDDVFFMTGADEHGQKIQEKAESVGMAPQAFCDSMIPDFKRVWEQYEIEYNTFARTTAPEHEQAVLAWIKKMLKLGYIYKSEYSGWYCVPCETFVTPTDTLEDKQRNLMCPTCDRALKQLSEESYFFRLSAFQDKLLEFYEAHPDFIAPKERMNEVISFVKSGLKDLSVSRKTVSWGIPFPGDPSHTVYVWGDALNIYLSAVGFGQTDPAAQEKFTTWWPANIQVMAKDIVRFHAVYWPAFLMAADIALPKKLLVHGYILMGENKMSKSRGNAIDPEQLAEWYGVEQVRYYLMRQMPISQDGQFDLKDLEGRVAADLANSLGNLLSRTTALAVSNGLQEVKPPAALETTTSAIKERAEEAYKLYWEEMNSLNYHIALAELWKFIAHVNAYFQTMQPWVLAKQNKEMFAEVIHATCQSLYQIAVLLWPVMPKKMELLLADIGHAFNLETNYDAQLRSNSWNLSFVLRKSPEALFVRPESRVLVEGQPAESPANSPAAASAQAVAPQASAVLEQPIAIQEIAIDDFAKVQLVVGTITHCEPMKGSDKLLKLQVDLGPLGMRQVLSGIAKSFKPEDLIGKQGVFVANLAPRKMMGELSHGMMILGKDGDTASLRMIAPVGSVPNGTRLT